MAETRIEDEIVVAAEPGAVLAAIKDPAAHAAWHPFVTEIAGEHRLGEVRRCSVRAGRKEDRTAERCVTDDGESITWEIEEDSTGFSRMVSGWRAGFRVRLAADGTHVTAESTFTPRSLPVRMLMPLMRRRFHGAQRRILAGLRDYVEAIPAAAEFRT